MASVVVLVLVGFLLEAAEGQAIVEEVVAVGFGELEEVLQETKRVGSVSLIAPSAVLTPVLDEYSCHILLAHPQNQQKGRHPCQDLQIFLLPAWLLDWI